MAEITSASVLATRAVSLGPVLPQRPTSAPEDRILLQDVSWERYRILSDALTECHVQLTYDRGRLELMTKSGEHETWAEIIAMLIWILTSELKMRRRSCGSMTCDREDLLRGIEPDKCWYIAHEPDVRGRNPIDLATDPPPDLAVEVDVTRSSLGRLPVYAAIGVPEVWRYDGETVTFYRVSEGTVRAMENSDTFPFVTPAAIRDVLRQWPQTDENTLETTFRQWVRDQLTKRE
jgi:Uma2 family endonuclease